MMGGMGTSADAADALAAQGHNTPYLPEPTGPCPVGSAGSRSYAGHKGSITLCGLRRPGRRASIRLSICAANLATEVAADVAPNGVICAVRGPGRYASQSAGQVRGSGVRSARRAARRRRRGPSRATRPGRVRRRRFPPGEAVHGCPADAVVFHGGNGTRRQSLLDHRSHASRMTASYRPSSAPAEASSPFGSEMSSGCGMTVVSVGPAHTGEQ